MTSEHKNLRDEVQLLEMDNEFQKAKNEDMEHKLRELEEDDRLHREYLSGFTTQMQDAVRSIQKKYESVITDFILQNKLLDKKLSCALENNPMTEEEAEEYMTDLRVDFVYNATIRGRKLDDAEMLKLKAEIRTKIMDYFKD